MSEVDALRIHQAKLRDTLQTVRAMTGATPCKNVTHSGTRSHALQAAGNTLVSIHECIETDPPNDLTALHPLTPNLFHVKTRMGALWIFVSGTSAIKTGSFMRTGGKEADAIIMEHDPKGPAIQYACSTIFSPRMCAHCEEFMAKSYKCSRCLKAHLHVRYCSQRCQRDHWKSHSKVCGLGASYIKGP